MSPTSRKSGRTKPKGAGRRTTPGKVRKEFWLDPTALAEAQAFLGTATERETVELAIELVAFRRDLAAGARVLAGMPLSRID
jgi:Arc/MetJ family transcription regulator